MINSRFGTSLLTALVLYCLLFDVSNIYSSLTKSAQYEPTSASSSGIGMITSAQPQSALIEKSVIHQPEFNAVSLVKVSVTKFVSKFRNFLLNIKQIFARVFKRKRKEPIFVEVHDIPTIVNKKKTNVKKEKTHSPKKESSSYPASWGGKKITEKEKEGLDYLDMKRFSMTVGGDISPFLHTATSADLLRFLRARNGNAEDAFKNILSNAKWRTSPYGADTILKENSFKESAMNKEVFWLGVSTSDCPTLVVRTQAHDGADYNEDPKIFTRYE